MLDSIRKYDHEAYVIIGQHIAEGITGAFDLAMFRAKNGDRLAQLEIGFAFAQGYCVEKDSMVAAEWYEKAAAQGVLNAKFNLGCLHYLGLGVERSVEKARYWFGLAAAGGHEKAKHNFEAMKAEEDLVREEQVYRSVLGIKKVPGLIRYELAHEYLADLKKLTSSADVAGNLKIVATQGRIPLSDFETTKRALLLIHNISSATPLSVETILNCAANNTWVYFDSMPKSGCGLD